jgi:putative flippase GtrA
MKSIEPAAPRSASAAVGRGMVDLALALWRREIIRYLAGGGANTALTYLIYLMLLFITSWQIANTISYVIGIFTAYYINARWVFRQPLRWSKAVQFPLVYLFQYALTMALSALLIDVVRIGALLPIQLEGLDVGAAVAPAVVTLVTIPATFLVTRLLLKPRRADQRELTAHEWTG